MKKIKYLLTIVIVTAICLSGCKNNKEGINGFEIENSKENAQGFVGEDLSWKSNVHFESQIKYVQVNFSSSKEGGWSFEKIYNDEFKGEKQYDLNDIISLPQDLPVGNYLFTIKAVSRNGETDVKKMKVNISVDSSRPYASKLDVGINAKKDNLHIESHISAPKKVQNIMVSIKWDSLSKEYPFEGKNITDEIDFTFHEHLDVSGFPKGNYEVILNVKDTKGKSAKTTGYFQK